MCSTVGIFGHYGNLNLGDEAIIAAVIQNIRWRNPQVRLYGFSINPEDTEKRHGIPSFPIRYIRKSGRRPSSQFLQDNRSSIATTSSKTENRQHNFVASLKNVLKKIPFLNMIARYVYYICCFLLIQLPKELGFLRRSYHTLKGVDLLLIAGSNQFLDNFGGSFGFPYTLLKWSIIAKLAGTRLAYVSVGAGPLASGLSQLMVKSALFCSDYISFRDTTSKKLIGTNGSYNKGLVYPDLAHSLLVFPKPLAIERVSTAKDRPVVGINVMPVYDSRYWYIHDTLKYWDYVRKSASFASALLQEDYPIFFFATQPKDKNVIDDVLQILYRENIIKREVNRLFRSSNTVDGLLEILAAADVIVATRFHGLVLSLLAEKPVLGICYLQKSVDLLRDIGEEEFSVPLDSFTWEELLRKFHSLEANRDEVVAKIRAKGREYRKSLSEQYDQVLGLIEN